MTMPPGGPYGQGPYGQGPYNQGPYGTNPYGQEPYWGGQPQGGPPQGGQPQGGQPQGGQPQGGPPQGGGYPYPPPGGDPYAGGAYPPQQQYPHVPQQYPAGWPGGPYQPGPPPGGRGSKTPWLIITGIAVLGVIVLVVILAVALTNRGTSNPASPSETTSAATSQPNNSAQTATGCTPNVSGGDASATRSTISAGKLSFPTSAAPGWTPFSDDQNPNLIDAVGVGAEVPGANQWMMQVEVAVTNFVTSMDVSQQASKLMDCVANGPGYTQSQPSLGAKQPSSATVDGVKAARVDADITIGDTARGVKGDSVTIIAVDTKPVTIFLGASPIGDAASRTTIDKVIAALKVTK